MDRRREKRRRQRLRVLVEPGAVMSVTGDLSPGGVFVHSARIYAPGTPVSLRFALPSGHAEARGVVRWAKRVPVSLMGHVRGGMGVQFTWVSLELHAFLVAARRPVRAVA